MSEAALPSIEDLATADALLVEQRCSRFETDWKAWRQGPRPSLEAELAGVPQAAHDVLLCELLRTELTYRRRHGETPTLAPRRAWVGPNDLVTSRASIRKPGPSAEVFIGAHHLP